MKPLGLNEIRQKYLDFFENKGHLVLPSFPLIPKNDKSLLLIAAGMAPLKPYFTGQETPPRKRIATCQKCIRTVDIENVGKTARHGDFFEMLGNFSFGDYFKEEVIPWAWEFVTKELGMPEDRLYVSVYEEDDEAFDIWNKKMGLPAEKIFRLGKDDNFWEHGTGPCGPCSEIHFDRGEKYGCGKEGCAVGCSCDRYIEIWNLVFTQFNKNEDGTYTRLQNPNIDTGMGLERVALVMQGAETLFDVDTIAPIRDEICKIARIKYNEDKKKDVSIRIITDHIRSVTYMTGDGVLPSNEGRGYVLRRLLRRAALHGKLLGISGAFLTELSKKVIEMAAAYPELDEKKDYIFKMLSVEENRFHEMLGQGMEILNKLLQTSGTSVISGSDAFKLYDTYGFPIDLVKEISEGAGVAVDEEGFKEEMRLQKERGRAAREDAAFAGAGANVYSELGLSEATIFEGYDTIKTNSQILALVVNDEASRSAKEGDHVAVFLDRTPFYAESGGQKGDRGIIRTETGVIKITDCVKVLSDKYAHIGEVTEGHIEKDGKAAAEVDNETRLQTARNHTATHLLQKALREVLGAHVEQAGSLVSNDRLRFDFTHFEPVSKEDLEKVALYVNDKILEAIPVNVETKPLEEAKAQGATALFGEKYGNEVRVVDINGYSIELCGGTHITNTAQAGVFKIVSENGIAQGVRRIEALTGKAALEYYKGVEETLNSIGRMLRTTPELTMKRLEAVIGHEKELSRELDKLKSSLNAGSADDLAGNPEIINNIKAVIAQVDTPDMNALKEIGDRIKDKLRSGVLVLASTHDDKVDLLVMATDDAVKAGIDAGGIIRGIAPVVGGKGGGRPNMAQAGGKDVSKLNEALDKAREIIKELS